MKKKKIIYRILEVLLLAGFLFIMTYSVNNSIVNWYSSDMEQALMDTGIQVTQAYDKYSLGSAVRERLYQALARISTQFIADETIEYNSEMMKELKQLIDVDGVYILDSSGRVIAASDRISNVLHPGYIRDLLNISEDQPVSKVISIGNIITVEDAEKYYLIDPDAPEDEVYFGEDDLLISGYLGDNRILVLRQDGNRIMRISTFASNTEEVLQNSNYGPNGFYLLGTGEYLLYNPIPWEGEFVLYQDLEIPPVHEFESAAKKVRLAGKDYLCRSLHYSSELPDDYLMCFLPYSEVTNVVIFVAVGETAAVLLAFWIMHASAQVISLKEDKKRISAKRRLVGGLLIGILLTVIISVLTMTLFLYSIETRDTKIKAEYLSMSVGGLDLFQEDGEKIYRSYMERIAKTSARLLSNNKELQSPEGLRKLAEDINAGVVLLLDSQGTVISSSRNYNGLKLPYSKDDTASEFRWLLYGKDAIVQKTANASFLYEPYYYSGAPMIDQENNYNGMVMIGLPVSSHDEMVSSTSLDSMVSSYGGNENMSLMAIERSSGRIFSNNIIFTDTNIKDLNITEEILKDGYTGFINIYQTEFIFCCAGGDKYITAASYQSLLTPLTGLAGGLILSIYGIMAEILFMVLRFAEIESEKNIRLTEEEKNRTRTTMDVIPYVLSGGAFLLMVFSRFFLHSNDMAFYVFVNDWAKGIHIYSITRCLLTAIAAWFVYNTINLILKALYPFLPTRQETILRLFMSVLKYAVTIGTIIYCAGMLGAPASSLVAISGVVTLIFSMGAQSLVADILSGLFIIFEGTYKVGDMITIDQWHGQVREIGIRNTRIFDRIENNVKVINNSTIRNIINYSETLSDCSVTIAVDYDQDYAILERIVKEEIPVMQKNIKYPIRNLRLKGIEEFQDSGILLKFASNCRNEDHVDVQRAMRREIKAMFDRHGIVVPFPQVVLSDRSESLPEFMVTKQAIPPQDLPEEETPESETKKTSPEKKVSEEKKEPEKKKEAPEKKDPEKKESKEKKDPEEKQKAEGKKAPAAKADAAPAKKESEAKKASERKPKPEEKQD